MRAAIFTACVCSLFTGALALASCVGDSATENANPGDASAPSDSSVDGSSTEPSPEAGSTADAGDAGDAAVQSCSVDTPFNTPTMVTELDTSGYEGELRLAANYLSAYFQSKRDADGGLPQIFSASRPTLTSPFGQISLIASVADAGLAQSPSVTGDDLNLYFLSAGGVNVAQRSTTQAVFGAPSVVLGLANPTYTPFVLENGSAMYIDDEQNIYHAAKATSGSISTPCFTLSVRFSSCSQSLYGSNIMHYSLCFEHRSITQKAPPHVAAQVSTCKKAKEKNCWPMCSSKKSAVLTGK